MLLAAHSVVLSERLKRMMKWLRALILKDNLTSLQNHDQNISENIWYFNYNSDDVLSSPYYDSHCGYHKRKCGVNVLVKQ